MMANRNRYNRWLSELQGSLLELAGMVDKAMRLSMFIIKTDNHALAEKLVRSDLKIEKKRAELEEEALAILITQQPVMAPDLRLINAITQIAGELERMGDNARTLARLNLEIKGRAPQSILAALEWMMQLNHTMLYEALSALSKNDAEAASAAASSAREICALYDRSYHELVNLMKEDSEMVEIATVLLGVLYSVKSLGGRITSICGRIIRIEDNAWSLATRKAV